MIDLETVGASIIYQKAVNATRRAQYTELTNEAERHRLTERVIALLACCTREHVTERLVAYGVMDNDRVVLYSAYEMQPDADNGYELDRLVNTPLCALDLDYQSLPLYWQDATHHNKSVRQLIEELLPASVRLYAMYGKHVDYNHPDTRLYYQITVRRGRRCCNDPCCYTCCHPLCDTASYLCWIDTISYGVCLVHITGICCLGNALYTWWAGP